MVFYQHRDIKKLTIPYEDYVKVGEILLCYKDDKDIYCLRTENNAYDDVCWNIYELDTKTQKITERYITNDTMRLYYMVNNEIISIGKSVEIINALTKTIESQHKINDFWSYYKNHIRSTQDW